MEGISRLKMGWALRKQSKRASDSTISPWAYIREGLLSDDHCVLDLGAYFREGLFYLFIFLRGEGRELIIGISVYGI